MAYQAALFDLDGTILDTAEDLRAAVEYALAQTGHNRALTIAEVKALFGSGAKTAFVRALRLEQGAALLALETVGTPADDTPAEVVAEAERALAVFRDYYPAHCELETRPYPGVIALMKALRAQGVRIAVISNKLDAAVQRLCGQYFPGLTDAALGEREPEVRRKPAPDMTIAALRQLGIAPENAVYIGDSEIDLETAKNAGLPCIAVSWGFRDRAFLARHGAARIASDAEMLRRCLLEE